MNKTEEKALLELCKKRGYWIGEWPKIYSVYGKVITPPDKSKEEA